MKTVLAMLFSAAVLLSCSDSGSKSDDTLNQGADTSSITPTPPTVDTMGLDTGVHADTLNVQKALRK